MSTPTDTQAVIDTALRSAQPHTLELGKVHAFVTPAGVKEIDLTGDKYKDTPSRKAGSTLVRDADSFIAYWDKHSDPDSEVYSDADTLTITAVLDANTTDAPRWARHRLTLELRTTEQWQQWMARDNQLMAQEKFAEFLEDHLGQLKDPDSATMLEIAQSIQAATKVDFQSGTRLSSGERQFKFVETVNAKAGQRGELTIPEVFTVGLVPFEGSEGYLLNARLRYRINSGLTMGYKLDDPRHVRDLAFADVLKTVSEHVGRPVMNGTPA